MPVIIVGRDGTRHRFPDDFDPQKAAAIVREQEGGAAPKMQTPPTQASLPGPTAPTPTAGPTGTPLQEQHTTLETALGVLNTIPRQIQQGIASGIDLAQGDTTLAESMKKQWAALNPHSKVSGETPLEAAGMQDGKLRSALGVGLDLITPVGPVGKVIGAGAKLIGKGAQAIPGVANASAALGKQFTKYHGLDKFKGRTTDMTMQDIMRLHDSTLDAASTVTKHQVAEIFKGLNEKDRWAIAAFLSDSRNKLPSARTDLQDAAFKMKKLFGDQAAAQVNMGFLDPATVVGKDYFPQVRRAPDNPRALIVDDVTATDRYTKKRTVPWAVHATMTDAKGVPLAVDPAKAAQVRLSAGERAMKTSDLLSLVGQEFGHNLKAAGPLPSGYRRLNFKNISVPEQQKSILQTMAFPEDIAETLEKAHVIEADPQGFRKMWVGANRAFKTAVTTFNPAHHANNLQGNMYLMYLGGMRPDKIVKAYAQVPELHALLGNPKYATLAAAARAKPLTANLTQGEAYDIARQYNVFGSSEAAIEFDRTIGKTPLGWADGARGVASKLGEKADSVRFKASQYIEDPARWALFKDQLLKGKTPEQAALHVKKHLFDYNELTDTEKKIRDYGAVPFYTFLRKNLPLHVTSLAENPGRLKNAQTVYAAPGRIMDPHDQALLADWQKEEGYQPIGGPDAEGSLPLVRLANPGLDLNKVPILGSTRSLLKSSLGPVPTAAVEYTTGRDLRTDAKILDTETGYVAASPLGTLGATLEMKTGIPMPRFGTVPNAEGTGFIQPEKVAFIMSQIPLPLLPYAQRIAGSPGETLGSQLQAGPGKIIKELILRSAGLTPRNLTAEQQDKQVEALLKAMFEKDDAQRLIKEEGEAMLRMRR